MVCLLWRAEPPKVNMTLNFRTDWYICALRGIHEGVTCQYVTQVIQNLAVDERKLYFSRVFNFSL